MELRADGLDRGCLGRRLMQAGFARATASL